MITDKVFYRSLVTSLFCLFSTILFSQTLTNQSLSNAGNYQENKNSLSWTIGQSAIQTIGSDSLFLTQGFQQIFIEVQTDIDQSRGSFPVKIRVYPNPADDYILVETSNQVTRKTDASKSFTGNGKLNDNQYNQIKLEMYNARGQLLYHQGLHNKHTQISLENYSKGVYMVHLTFGNKRKVFKIIKGQ